MADSAADGRRVVRHATTKEIAFEGGAIAGIVVGDDAVLHHAAVAARKAGDRRTIAILQRVFWIRVVGASARQREPGKTRVLLHVSAPHGVCAAPVFVRVDRGGRTEDERLFRAVRGNDRRSLLHHHAVGNQQIRAAVRGGAVRVMARMDPERVALGEQRGRRGERLLGFRRRVARVAVVAVALVHMPLGDIQRLQHAAEQPRVGNRRHAAHAVGKEELRIAARNAATSLPCGGRHENAFPFRHVERAKFMAVGKRPAAGGRRVRRHMHNRRRMLECAKRGVAIRVEDDGATVDVAAGIPPVVRAEVVRRRRRARADCGRVDAERARRRHVGKKRIGLLIDSDISRTRRVVHKAVGVHGRAVDVLSAIPDRVPADVARAGETTRSERARERALVDACLAANDSVGAAAAHEAVNTPRVAGKQRIAVLGGRTNAKDVSLERCTVVDAATPDYQMVHHHILPGMAVGDDAIDHLRRSGVDACIAIHRRSHVEGRVCGVRVVRKAVGEGDALQNRVAPKEDALDRLGSQAVVKVRIGLAANDRRLRAISRYEANVMVAVGLVHAKFTTGGVLYIVRIFARAKIDDRIAVGRVHGRLDGGVGTVHGSRTLVGTHTGIGIDILDRLGGMHHVEHANGRIGRWHHPHRAVAERNHGRQVCAGRARRQVVAVNPEKMLAFVQHGANAILGGIGRRTNVGHHTVRHALHLVRPALEHKRPASGRGRGLYRTGIDAALGVRHDRLAGKILEGIDTRRQRQCGKVRRPSGANRVGIRTQAEIVKTGCHELHIALRGRRGQNAVADRVGRRLKLGGQVPRLERRKSYHAIGDGVPGSGRNILNRIFRVVTEHRTVVERRTAHNPIRRSTSVSCYQAIDKYTGTTDDARHAIVVLETASYRGAARRAGADTCAAMQNIAIDQIDIPRTAGLNESTTT